MTKLSKRNEFLSLSKSKVFDVLVIGGGASGLASAVDAARRGFSVLLLEQNDYAKATSSRSTKILHGGVRYLAQGNISLVKNALREKLLNYANAPHLARPMDFIIPCDNILMQGFYGMGMLTYDALSGFPSAYRSRLIGDSLQKSLKEVAHRYTKRGVIYNDGQFDDARMAFALVKTLHREGGISINYAKVIGFLKEQGEINGVEFLDKISSETFKARAKCVINATGIYSDKVALIDNPDHQESVTLAQGIHLVVNKSVYSSESAMLIPKTSDGRVLFFIPWYNKVIIGTTDTQVQEIEDDPRPIRSEIQLIIDNANSYLAKPLQQQDITSVYAGIRPLIKAAGSTKGISREEKISISTTGLISIIGGKWTTYRHMGEKIIDFAITQRKLVNKSSNTKTMRLYGYLPKEEVDLIPYNYKIYGSDYDDLSKIEGFAKYLHPDLPICEAQIRWHIRNEYAYTLDDILARRSRCLFLNAQATIDIAKRVVDIMAEEMSKNEQWKIKELEDFTTIANGYLISNYL